MLCGGLSVYSPLKRNSVGPGKSVAVIGIGGLGFLTVAHADAGSASRHFAVQFARAMGAENVVAFTHSANKEKDARELGATDVVVTTKKDFADPWKQEFDLIICTIDVSHGLPLALYLKTLRVHGRFIMVAVPDEKLPELHAFDFLTNGALYGGSLIGCRKEVLEMLDLAVKKGVKSWIEVLPIIDASFATVKEAGKAVQNTP
ncbi:hypothetical protein H0H92_001169 [Tricholoma furcatifolium]|nr:hypothetical protein H0H92_001169 [Tricholoma furcatifolium]